jgi:hypothetical protein
MFPRAGAIVRIVVNLSSGHSLTPHQKILKINMLRKGRMLRRTGMM